MQHDKLFGSSVSLLVVQQVEALKEANRTGHTRRQYANRHYCTTFTLGEWVIAREANNDKTSHTSCFRICQFLHIIVFITFKSSGLSYYFNPSLINHFSFSVKRSLKMPIEVEHYLLLRSNFVLRC